MNPAKFFRSLLPGIFLFAYCIGTGSVTAMAKAGADYGMALLWTVLLSCLITFYLIDLYGKFTLVTGESALAAFRKYLHPAVGLFFIVALTINVSGSVIGVMEPTDFAVRLEFERGGYVLPEESRFMGRDVSFAADMIDFNAYSSG